MERRIFLAIVISLALLWGWAAIAPKLFPDLVKTQEPVTSTASTSTAGTSTSTAASSTAPATATSTAAPAPGATLAQATPQTLAPVAATSVQVTVVDTPNYTARFSNRGGQLISFRLKHYKEDDGQLVELVKAREPHRYDFPFEIQPANAQLLVPINTSLYTVSDRTDRGVRVLEYRWSSGGVAVTKTYRMSPEYQFGFSAQITPAQPYRLVIGPGIRTLSDEEQKDTQVIITGNGVVQREGKFKIIGREKGDALQLFERPEFIGIEDNYFLTVLRPQQSGEGILRRGEFQVDAKRKRKDLYAALNATGNGIVAGEAYFGPKETQILDRYNLGEALQFGWFSIIGRFFLQALIWINTFTHNYGFAIIVLTIIIKICLFPLQYKSIVSMRKMQTLQPKMEAIKAKYKKAKTDPDQRQKMNTEVMQLYQKEGVNPMAGCFPMLLQLPILWGFYGLLSRAIELRNAPFILWIQDLSDKDPYYITPILMTITWLLQTAITPSTGDPMQRRIFMIMPLFFGFLFKDFPSGLVLYWLVQNVLTIIQQLIMNKWWKDHPKEDPKV
ncbi:MAG TPA: membrane protein insertase YidC [Thermoanaerobaculia bacterium]|jgi:YidC/Oxa1 family membrane protein insertase